MAEAMKPKNYENKARMKRAAKWVAAPLVAGMLALGCGDDIQKITSYRSLDVNKTPITLRVVDKDACKKTFLTGDGLESGLLIDNRSKKSDMVNIMIMKGDVLWRVDTVGLSANHPTKGYLIYQIADVDKDGVLIKTESFNRCEVSYTFFRVNFDGTNSFSNTKLSVFYSDIRVEKTIDSNVAKLSVKL